MITSEPKDWKDLQDKVNFILTGVGLISEKEANLKTPRGTVEIDVYAFDPNSVDEIKYIIECKNWNNTIPQTVIHSFTTVMNETGGNIGYIISKKGFQKGAKEYVENTNIKLFSYIQFQEHYFDLWYRRYFAKEIYKYCFSLVSYTEPINSRRFRHQESFNENKEKTFNELSDKYSLFSFFLMTIASCSLSGISNKLLYTPNIFSKEKLDTLTLEQIKGAINESLGITIKSNNFTDLLIELKKIIDVGTNEFIAIFGKNIFEE
jgi:restriction system protein